MSEIELYILIACAIGVIWYVNDKYNSIKSTGKEISINKNQTDINKKRIDDEKRDILKIKQEIENDEIKIETEKRNVQK